ncbi:hypothetical protein SAMN04490205_3968 [Pseudomonas trivialis]|uniref:Uncharacterized protein n=2 Tax=Pseudomonas trivialis TaxID=200450 RepID=A0ABY0ULX1_9PSED|nr:hypothetical protein SAMN04490205_3968 [Pseudomonas trivialis]
MGFFRHKHPETSYISLRKGRLTLPFGAPTPPVNSLASALTIYHRRTLHNYKDAVGWRDQGRLLDKEGNAVSDDSLLIPPPRLDGLMELRDAVVALNGPLADDPAVQENLQRQLFNEERETRVLGRISAVSAQKTRQIPFG